MAETRTKEQIDQEYGNLAARLGDCMIRMDILKPQLHKLVQEAEALVKNTSSQEESTLG